MFRRALPQCTGIVPARALSARLLPKRPDGA